MVELTPKVYERCLIVSTCVTSCNLSCASSDTNLGALHNMQEYSNIDGREATHPHIEPLRIRMLSKPRASALWAGRGEIRLRWVDSTEIGRCHRPWFIRFARPFVLPERPPLESSRIEASLSSFGRISGPLTLISEAAPHPAGIPNSGVILSLFLLG